jgi:hypothetical protein
MAQTFLNLVQVAELVALYKQGMTLPQLAARFSIHKRTPAAHLVRMSVPMRQRGLTVEQVPEASRLYGRAADLTRLRPGPTGVVSTACAARG